MALYYITGVPGSGKSSILTELQRRGYEVYETDDLAAFYHKSGKKPQAGKPAAERTPEWRRYHEWKISIEKINELAQKANDKTIFLCGVVANDVEFWDKFTAVFCLYVPPETIEQRLAQRPDNNYGKNAHELATGMKWAAYSKKQYLDLGAVIVDARQSIVKLTDDILTTIDTPKG